VRDIVLSREERGTSLLDVGCRGCELQKYVKGSVRYSGVDLIQNGEKNVDHVLDVEKGLPFGDGSYDIVVALDLIEHLNDLQGGLEEMLRVARKTMVVMVPNLAYVTFRRVFFLSGSFSRLTDKFDLTYGMGTDRHRWLTVLPQVDEYMKRFADAKRIDVKIHWFNDSQKKELFARIGGWVGLSPPWWVWSSIYVFDKAGSNGAIPVPGDS
jgi:SAM-dependent methyltransferase